MTNRFAAAAGGISSGAGDRAKPWTLAHAAAGAGGALVPGDVVWLAGGTYPPAIFTAVGTAAAPIIFRALPGERVTLAHGGTGNIAQFAQGTPAAHLRLWGLEIVHTDPRRQTAQTGSWPSDMPRASSAGVNLDGGVGIKLINCVLHDCGNGIGAWAAAHGTELYGCLSYYHGWQAPDRGHGHGIYAQNDVPTLLIRDCLIWGNFQVGLHLYSESGKLQNITAEGCCCWNAGKLCNEGQAAEILIESGQVIRGLRLAQCFTAFDDGGAGDGASSHYGEYYNALHEDLTVQGCVFHGRQRLNQWRQVRFTGNRILSKNRMVEIINDGVDPRAWNIADNRYWRHAGSQWAPFIQVVDGSGQQWDFAGWQAATGHDVGSNFVEGSFPGEYWVFVRPNLYEPGRAHVIVYNWPLGSVVGVNLTTAGFAPGQGYEVRKAENFYGPPVASGTYNPADPVVTLPMTDRSMAAPIGCAAPPSSLPGFGMFVVLPTEAAPVPPVPPPPVPPPPVPPPVPPPPVPPEGATWSFGTAAPTTGTHRRGEIVWNTTPSAGGPIGWVCVASGSPGRWKPFGTIGR